MKDYEPGDIVTTSDETNRYWRRLFQEGSIDSQDWVSLNHIHTAQNQKFVMEKYHFRSQAFKEVVFELHRLRSSLNLPSRRTCRFLMRDPCVWEGEMTGDGPDRQVFRIEINRDERSLRADASWLGNNAADYAQFEDWAERYWAGEQRDGTHWEVLFEGEFEVIEEVGWDGA